MNTGRAAQVRPRSWPRNLFFDHSSGAESKVESTVKCPHDSCGRVLTVESRAHPFTQAVEVGQLAGLSMALANRRYRLSLAADDIDNCAGPVADTVLLIVQALGGRLILDWGKPPRVTQQLTDTSLDSQKVKTSN